MHINIQTPTAADLPIREATAQHESRHGIKADVLIPGRGQPSKHAAVIIEETKIVWVGSQSDIPAVYSDISFIKVPILMPGMWDCHVHFSGTSAASLDVFGDNPTLAGARTTRDLANTLMAGFTSVRELAGYGGFVSPAVRDGTIVGPNIYSSIAALSMTAGHGELHNIPLSAVLDQCAHNFPGAVCDGVDECLRAVRAQLRRGAKVIKVCASGGVGSELDDPEDRQFSDAELRAIVEEAGRAKRIVAAHCHGKEGIMAALKAGAKTIEHGSYLDEEVCDLMIEKGAIFVPTRSITEGGLKMKKTWTPAQYEKLKIIVPIQKKAYALAVKRGVKVALGTDLCVSDLNTPLSHGKNGLELFYAVEAGMTALEAIEACTAIAPETLGPQAPKSGQLRAGYDADLIAVSLNPLDDIKILAEAENIEYVWRAGKLWKEPRR